MSTWLWGNRWNEAGQDVEGEARHTDLQSTDATDEEKAVGYACYLPAVKVYNCDTATSGADLEEKMKLDGYQILSHGKGCSFMIYLKDGIVYVTFKGTDSAATVWQDTRMAVKSLWHKVSSPVLGDAAMPSFVEELLLSAESSIGRTYKALPRRYVGHSLGGAYALRAYIEHGRPQDVCHVFSPYMGSPLALSIAESTAQPPIVVWAHKADPFWKTAKMNYDRENTRRSADNAPLVWHDTSQFGAGSLSLSATDIQKAHTLDHLIPYWRAANLLPRATVATTTHTHIDPP